MITEYAVPSLALNYHSKKYQIIYESVYSYLCTCMRNKYECKSEFVWNVHIQVMLKVISISILDQHAWACWDMVARGIVFLNSQTGSQMYTFPDQMNWQFVQILIHFKFQSKLRVLDTDDVKQKTSFFSVRDNLLAMFSWFFVFLFYVSSVSVTQNKCPNSHHSHPVHLFNTWISRECKLQNGWIS